MYSSVCGVGLDTIPIPGNTPTEEIAALYMEISALSYRLNKPLTCRLLPIKGKEAGEYTELLSPYLCNTKIFKLWEG